ncbi:APC family permease [Anaerobaca lacustris]|uniref:Amino acid permease n=1 Tax=Anaerobaca lacustris TaxID=3044600 RepID=A0AAW6U6Y7_9BACT|nr:amino acid permease [Sedimentisphaerales bacterium M17dextr]
MPKDELQRGFGLSTSTYVVIASMVGTGILVSPGFMMASLQNYPLIFGLWVLGGLLALCGALCVAELAAALPRAGGEYVYLREAYGPMPAFLSGWTSFFLGFSAPLAVASYIAAQYLLTPFELGTGYRTRMLATAIIVAVTLPNLIGHRHSAWTQNLTTLIKLGLFVGLVVLAMLFRGGRLSHIAQGQPIGEVGLGTAMTQLFFVMFAYSGWNAASYLAGEVRNPGKTLPRSLLLGAGSVVLLYLAVNLVFAYAVPLENVGFADGKVHPTQVPQLAVENLFGVRASNVFSVLLGLTFLATVSAFIITGPRVYYAMARDGLFPSIAGRTSPRGGVPTYAMVLQSVCAVVILFVMDFQDLYQYAAVGLSLFALLFIGAVYVLRWRRPEMERPFRVPGYPVVPAIFMAVTLFMAVFAFQQWRTPSLLSVGSILLGIPVYYIWTFIRRRPATTTEAKRSVD